MNIIDIQDDLKNFSEDQLINEMQRPSGNAPQFLVLSEITRRKRMRDDFNMRKAASEPTVAQEAVASAGVPAQGIMGMSEAMAPKAAMAQGGIGSVMSQPMKSQMPQPAPMPQDGIMAMSSGGSTRQRIREVRMKNGKIGLFQGNTFLGTKQERDDAGGDSLASQIGFGQKGSIVESIKDALGFSDGGRITIRHSEGNMTDEEYEQFMREQAETEGMTPEQRIEHAFDLLDKEIEDNKPNSMSYGGVIKAQNGLPLGLRKKNPGNIRPGAGFIGETGDDDGGYATFGSDDEGLRAIQRLLMTYGDKYGVNTLRGLANRYAPPSDNNPTENYIDFLADKTGIDPDAEINLADRGSDIIPAIVGFEQGQQPYSQAQIDRAIRAAGTEDPTEVSSILAEPLDDNKPTMLSNIASELNPFSVKTAAASSFTPTGNIQMMLDNKSDQDDSQKELRSGRRRRRAGADVLTEADRDVMTVADSFGVIQDILDNKAPTLSDVSGPITNPTQRRIDSASRRMADDFGDEFGNIPDLDPKPTVIKDAEEIDLTSPKLLSEAERRRLSRTGRLTGVTVENRTDSSTETSDETETKKEKAADADPNKPIYSPQAAGAVSSLESEILAMQDRMKKSAEQDKWLSLAQAGLALMSSTNPTLLGALGEAGISGLSAMKEAESRYQEGVVDLINARAKLAKSTTGMDAGNAVTRLGQIERALGGADGMTLSEPDRQRLLQERLYLQRFIKIPEFTTGANTPPPAS